MKRRMLLCVHVFVCIIYVCVWARARARVCVCVCVCDDTFSIEGGGVLIEGGGCTAV